MLTINSKANISIYILLGLLILACLAVFKSFLFGENYLLYTDIGSDAYNQVYPYNKLIIDTIAKDGWPRWSFQQGLGQYIGAFNIGSPLNWLIYLMGNKYLPYSIGLVEFIKFILTGFVFYKYLRLLKLSPFACMIGAFSFALSGYMSIMAGWVNFNSYLALLFAFWLFALELFLQKKWHYLPIAVALIAMDQPFTLYIFGEFALFYFFIWFANLKLSKFELVGKLTMLFFTGLIGLLIGSFLLFPNLTTMMDSPRGGGGYSYFGQLINTPFFEPGKGNELGTIAFRFFGNNILGVGNEYKGWGNYLEAPALFMGVFVLLFSPQIFVFYNGKIRKRLFVLLAIILVMLLFPFFRISFWAFTGDYYRILALFIGSSFLIASTFVISKIETGSKLNIPLLVGSFVFWCVLLLINYSQNWGSNLVEFERMKSLFVLTLIFGLILTYHYSMQKNYLYVIFLITFFDAIEIAHTTLTKREMVSVAKFHKKIGYNDATIEALNWIKKQDKSFYRVEKDYSSGLSKYASVNDAMVQDYYGASVYTSFNHKNHASFLVGIGAIESNNEMATRWISDLRKRPVALGNLGVKYALSKGSSMFQNFGYEFIKAFGDIKVYKNLNAMPMGFVYKNYILESKFNSFSTFEKDISLFKSFVISDDMADKFANIYPVEYSLKVSKEGLSEYAKELNTNTLKMKDFSNNHFTGTINLKEPGLLYFSIPFDTGWEFWANGLKQEKLKVNFGMTGILLKEGNYKIKAAYQLPFFYTSIITTLLGLLIYFGWIYFEKRMKLKETKLL